MRPVNFYWGNEKKMLLLYPGEVKHNYTANIIIIIKWSAGQLHEALQCK